MRGRAITVLLSVDPAGVTDRDSAIDEINTGNQVVVAADEIAYDVLVALGAEPVNARNSVRWSHGISADELESLDLPSISPPVASSTNVSIPDDWSTMTSDEKDAFVSAALQRIAIESGLIGDDSAYSERSDT